MGLYDNGPSAYCRFACPAIGKGSDVCILLAKRIRCTFPLLSHIKASSALYSTGKTISTLNCLLSGHGIVAASSPGIAAKDAPNSQEEAFDGAMLLYGLNGILRTSWCEPARGRCHRGYDALIETYGGYQKTYQKFTKHGCNV